MMSTTVNDGAIRLLNTMSVDQASATAKSEFARRLREAINSSDLRGVRQSEQARQLGLDKALLSQWLNGRTANPQYLLVRKAAERLGVNVEWLLGEEVPQRAMGVAEDAGDKATMRPTERGVMNLQQQKEAAAQLIEDMPRAERARALFELAQKAFREGWIDEVPDAIMATWSAKEKIAAIKKKTGPGTN